MAVKAIQADNIDVEDPLGSPIERREDPDLLTGEAEFTDDTQRPRIAHWAILRSPHGHAEFQAIDVSEAEEFDVIAVSTSEEVEIDYIDMPLSAETVWQAVNGTEGGA